MSDPSSQSEPTMEEILASIRKIISEDSAPEREEEKPAEEPQAPAEAEEEEEEDEDVLELTQMVGEDDNVVDLEREKEAAEEAEMPAPAEEEEDEPAAEPEPDLLRDFERPTPAAPDEDEDEDSLLADTTRAAAVASFSELADATGLHRSRSRFASEGGLTVEALVRDALEPHLKTWLDENLADLVERIVREEVQKMIRRAEYR